MATKSQGRHFCLEQLPLHTSYMAKYGYGDVAALAGHCS